MPKTENMPHGVAMKRKSRCGQCSRSCFTTSCRRPKIRWRMAATSPCHAVRSAASARIPCTMAAPRSRGIDQVPRGALAVQAEVLRARHRTQHLGKLGTEQAHTERVRLEAGAEPLIGHVDE